MPLGKLWPNGRGVTSEMGQKAKYPIREFVSALPPSPDPSHVIAGAASGRQCDVVLTERMDTGRIERRSTGRARASR
jgi:hypothetical protein